MTEQRRTSWIAACLALLVAYGAAMVASAQETPAPGVDVAAPAAAPGESPPTVEALGAEIERLRGALEEAPEEARAAIGADLDTAKAATDAARAMEADRAAFERDAKDAPALLETIRAELAAPPGEPQLGLSASPTVSEVEQAINQANAELKAAQDEAASFAEQKTFRATRLTEEIPKRIAEARDERRAIVDKLGAGGPDPDAPLAERVRNARLRAELLAADRRIARLEAEQQSYIAREQLLPARADRAQRRAQVIQERLSRLQARLSEARQRQATQAAEQATRLKEDAKRFAEGSPTLGVIAEENVELTSQLSGQGGITERLNRVDRRIRRVNGEIDQIRENFREVRQRVEETGLTDAVGLILRRELDALQDSNRILATSMARSGNVSEAQLQVVQLDDRIDDLQDVGTLLEKVRGELPADRPDEFRLQVEQVAQEVVEQRKKNLTALRDAYSDYVTKLADLQRAERELIEVTEAYRTYIDERILWVRSVIRGRLLIRPVEVVRAATWLVGTPEWLSVPRVIMSDVTRRPPVYVGLVLLVVTIFGVQGWARRGLRVAGERVSSFRTDRFSVTLAALGCTLVRALPWPLTLFVAGVALRLAPDQATVALAVGAGLRRVAVTYLLIQILRRLVKPGGVGDVHFRWRKAGARVIRSNLRWFVPIALPMLLVRVATQESGVSAYAESLGRLCFIVAMVSLSVFTARVLSPRGAFIKPMLGEGSWLHRLRFIWYPILPGLALTFAVLPLFGYFSSAVRLMTTMGSSFWFILLVVTIHALMNRWLFIARRRLAVENARKAREAAAAARKQSSDPTSVDIPVEDQVDIPALDQQTRRLFRIGVAVLITFGLFAIWSDVLPALRMLQRVQLWPTVQIVDLPLSSIDPILLEREAPASGGRGDVAPGAQKPGDVQASNGSAGASGAPGGNGGAAATDSGGSSGGIGVPGLSGMTSSSGGSVAGAGAGAGDGGASSQVRRITLSDVGLAIIIAVITILAGRNVPGLLEIAFLTKLPLDSGSRFAITTVARYAILIVGITIAFGAVKIGWSQIQWLAAALTFGLAFGLQEIFANFVSGLIILAERPVRVGDTVTVGTVSGTVSRIQMRATTITDWDRKELIVPNKSFITDQVINWSLSSTILRVIVEVGIAYGSDVDKAEKLLFEAAEDCEFLVSDPPPRVWFTGFGDNALNFRLQGYIADIDHMLMSKSALHFLINRKFADAGISIAFPQRDVHLDTSGPIQIRIVDAEGKPVADPAEPGASPG